MSPNRDLDPTCQKLDPLPVPLRLDLRQEIVRWNPIAPSTEDSNAIDLEKESGSLLSVQLVLHNLGVAESDPSPGRRQLFVGLHCVSFAID